ncbi:YheC/YheD family protein [Bacillus sp. FJAT-50079]|uniref:YheC/YheD family protein n=1 Tax=Bacillus sp. FJAT-50079 TaxID=2833577 RepID=UPI001BC94A4F|nr:YheC/YheD family protein [Bacillus sp. FJAT-50079]MBS4206957.1 YheC/YheD family protein [Bacillus sp. FJAT-50079]
MKANWGRVSLYKQLWSEELLQKHLVETALFSKEVLLSSIEKYKSVLIKPAFGSGQICISLINGIYAIRSYQNAMTTDSLDEAYEYIVENEIHWKYAIVQPSLLHAELFPNHFPYIATVHRDSPSAEWVFIPEPKKNHPSLGKFIFENFIRKLKKLAILTAQSLGNTFPNCNTVVVEMIYNLQGDIWIQDTILHPPISKWSQYQTLVTQASLRSYVPHTALLTKISLHDFLEKYKRVIIKPCLGQEGKGVATISLTSHGYELHSGRKTLTMSTLDEAYQFIEKNYLSKKYYLIQKWIPLITIDDCPIDVRVVTQKLDSIWYVTGKIVKVASQDYMITNVAQKLLTFEDAFHQAKLPYMNIDRLENKINQMCIAASHTLEKENPNISLVGFDIGMTSATHVFIIEGNYTPELSMFNLLDDKTMYRDILNFKKRSSSPF